MRFPFLAVPEASTSSFRAAFSSTYTIASVLSALLFSQLVAGQDILLQEDFQSGGYPVTWSTGISGDYRVRVMKIPALSSSDFWLVLDDSVEDSKSAQTAIEAPFNMSGYETLTISFEAYSFDDETQSPYFGTDGVALAVNEQIIFLDTDLHSYIQTPGKPFTYTAEVHLPSQMFGFDPKTNYAASLLFFQYDNSPTPEDGWAFDDIKVTGTPYRGITATAPAEFDESAGGFQMDVAVFPAPTTDLTLTVTFDDGTTSKTVNFPRGATQSKVWVPYPDDSLLNGARYLSGEVKAPLYGSIYWYSTVKDDERATLTLTVPDTLKEGEYSESPNATLTISPAVAYTTWIRLESEPAYEFYSSDVYVEAGQTQVSFTLNANDDYYVEDTTAVTVEAVFEDSRSPKQTVTIVDNDSFAPRWGDAMYSVTEGEPNYSWFSIYLGAATRETITFSLKAEPAGVLNFPDTITVTEGYSEAWNIDVTAVDDSVANGNRTVKLIATPMEGSPFSDPISTTVNVRDNDVSSFTVNFGPMLISGGVGELEILAFDASGQVLDVFNGLVTVSLVAADGTKTALLPSPVSLNNGRFTAEVTIKSSMADSRILVENADGATGLSPNPFSVHSAVAFTAKDMLYDQSRDRIIVSTGTDGLAGHLNSLTEFNPYTGATGRKLAVGSGLNKIELTSDGSYLYASLDGSNAIQRVAMGDLSLAEKIELGHPDGWYDANFNAGDMLTIPGKPLDLVVAHYDVWSSYTFTGYYQEGSILPKTIYDASSLAPSSVDGEYLMSSYYSVGRFKVDDEGLAATEQKSGMFTDYGESVKSDNGWVVSSRGEIGDDASLRKTGRFQLPQKWYEYYWGDEGPFVHEIDHELSRAIFARNDELAVYDRFTKRLVFHTQFEGMKGNITGLTRYGTSGLAIRTDQSELLFIDSELIVPRGAPVDISIELTPSTNKPKVGETLTYTVTVRNASTIEAKRVKIALELSSAHANVSVSSQTNLGWTSSNVAGEALYVDLDALPAETTVVFTVTATPSEVRALLAELAANSSAVDPSPLDNLASTMIHPSYALEPNQWERIYIGANRVLWLPNRGILLIATNEQTENELRNRLIGIVPSTGELVGALEMDSPIHILAVSKDEKRLYAAGYYDSYVHRVDLDSWTATGSIPLESANGSFEARDIHVLEGHDDLIAVGSDYNGVTIFKDGLPLPDATGIYSGSLVEPSSDPSIIYALNTAHSGAELLKIGVSESGAEILSSKRALLGDYNYYMKSDGDLIYGSSGTAVRGDLMSVDGTFAIMSIRNDGNWYSGFEWDVEPEVGRQRVYFNGARALYSFDSASHLLVRSVPLLDENDYAATQSLERWGDDGFALRISDGSLLIGRSDIVPQTGPYDIDLLVDQANGEVIDVADLPITISGKAFAGQGIQSVHVNGIEASTTDDFATWSIELDSLAPGYGTIEIAATDNQAEPAVKIVSIDTTYFIPGDDDFDGIDDDWERLRFPGQALENVEANDDADGDGFANRHEFLFDMDPSKMDQPYKVSFERDSDGSVVIVIKARRYKEERYQFKPEASHDMMSWKSLEAEVAPEVTPGPENSLYDDVTYRIPNESSRHSNFFRLSL